MADINENAQITSRDVLSPERQQISAFNEIGRRLGVLENIDLFPGFVGMYRDTAGGQDLNTSAGVAIEWNAETIEDASYFTHSTGVNPSRITAVLAGYYMLSAGISGENQTVNPKNVRLRIQISGGAFVPVMAYAYAADATDEWLTASLTGVIFHLTAGQYIEAIVNGEGSEVDVGSCNSVAGASYLSIMKIK